MRIKTVIKILCLLGTVSIVPWAKADRFDRLKTMSCGAQTLAARGLKQAEILGGARARMVDGQPDVSGNFSGLLMGAYTVYLTNGGFCEVDFAASEFVPITTPLKDAYLLVKCSNGRSKWVLRGRG